MFLYMSLRYDMTYLLTAIVLTLSGSSTEHIYTKKIHRINNEIEYPEQNVHSKNNTERKNRNI